MPNGSDSWKVHVTLFNVLGSLFFSYFGIYPISLFNLDLIVLFAVLISFGFLFSVISFQLAQSMI